jgi:hypothetical protein
MGEESISGWHSRRVPAAAVALRCAGCGRPSDETARGWLGRLVVIGGLPEVVFVCPACAGIDS